MTVILENSKLFDSKTITTPHAMGFAAMVKYVRGIEPDRAWQIVDYG